MLSGHQILVRPIVTEKNTALNEVGKYTFEVLDREQDRDQARG
jgi:ribosomal protein L23